MGLALSIIVMALGVGLLAGGGLGGLARLRLHALPLLLAALTIQLLAALSAGMGAGYYPTGLAVSAVLACWFAVRNRAVAGVPLIAAGLLLNALVVVANGKMPVSAAAAARAGVPVQELVASNDPRHLVTGEAVRLSVLGEVIPVPLPYHREVDSIGDLLLAAGLGLLVLSGTLRTPAARSGRRWDKMPRMDVVGADEMR